ncbi:hypothetical protein BGX34_000616 [Mortierella sp. NVP85]|nr:hypothetical protein BGX34_000616 [Mortierella sp. NVP85]
MSYYDPNGTGEHLILEIKCSRPQQQQARRKGTITSSASLDVEPKQIIPSSLDVRGRYKDLLNSRWSCNIARYPNNTQTISIKLKMLDFQSERIYPAFNYLHCIPYDGKNTSYNNHSYNPVYDIYNGGSSNSNVFSLSGCSLMRGGEYTLSVQEQVLFDKKDSDKYAFYLVLSTSQSLPVVFMTSSVPESTSFKRMFPELHQTMLRLLKDPASVNVAFVFTIHNCQRKVALWANRTILDKHLRLQELFSAASHKPTMIPIEGISLTTFCVLLKYLYTEDLDLTVDPSQYLMCDMDQFKDERSVDSISSSEVLNKTLKEYNAAQFYATWNVKDKVTWSDLFLAADRFEITDLRKQCLDNLLVSVDKSNAMEILFGVGMCFRKEIREPVMKFISEHLDDVFSLETQDPFKRFADHEGCHEVMLELLRLSRAK